MPPMNESTTPLSYRDAGVDVDAGNALVERIKPLAASTRRPGLTGGLGGFAGLFDLRGAGYQDPVLVSATDGVGTKLKLAIAEGRHEAVGIDLVAMCVNDLVCQGAEPLFFLDYFATGRLEVDIAERVVAGIAEGCRLAGCALLGGETAEMPGMYAEGEYDLAGFAVGAAERGQLIDGSRVRAGDALIGFASSGCHSNGYSLVRRVLERAGGGAGVSIGGRPLNEVLLTPTRIYVPAVRALVGAGLARGIAHITGGGLIENVPRSLPDDLAARLDPGAWPRPPVFDWLTETGGVDTAEMRRTFNEGLGMVVAVPADAVASAAAAASEAGETVYRVGEVVKATAGRPRVTFTDDSQR